MKWVSEKKDRSIKSPFMRLKNEIDRQTSFTQIICHLKFNFSPLFPWFLEMCTSSGIVHVHLLVGFVISCFYVFFTCIFMSIPILMLSIYIWFRSCAKGTLKEKRVLKQCPWGTVLKNGAFFDKQGTILVPLGHQNEVVPPDKRAPMEKYIFLERRDLFYPKIYSFPWGL